MAVKSAGLKGLITRDYHTLPPQAACVVCGLYGWCVSLCMCVYVRKCVGVF